MAALLPLWSFGGAAHKRAVSEKKEGEVGVTLKVKEEELHKWEFRDTHWSCSICRGFTFTGTLPKNRKRQRCKGLADRLAKDAEFSLGHQLAEFVTPQGTFTICSLCGFYGARKSVGLSTACDGKPSTRTSKEQWRRVFVKGRHPRTNKPLGLNLVVRSQAFVKSHDTRSVTERRLKKIRLTKKSSPWVAASSGILGPPSDEVQEDAVNEAFPSEPDEDMVEMEEDEYEDDPYGEGAIDINGMDVAPVPEVPEPAFDLEGSLDAVMDLNQPPSQVAREVLEHVCGILPPPVPSESDNRTLKEKLLEKWIAKKSGKATEQPASSSSDGCHRWWE